MRGVRVSGGQSAVGLPPRMRAAPPLHSDVDEADLNPSITPAPVQSPCIGICRLGPDGRCEGCLRTGDEIARWLSMSETERRRLMDEVLPERESGRA